MYPAHSTRRARHLATIAAFLVAGLGTTFAADPARTGTVQFSDGEDLAGAISLAPGYELKLHGPAGLSVLSLNRVRELRFAPRKEAMERKWQFVEAGRTEKEFWGEPYPVRHIAVTAVLADGDTVTGHLYTTAFYVEREDGNAKVVVRAKQRGKEGQTLEDLPYPVRITFLDDATPTPDDLVLRVQREGKPVQAVSALTLGPLVRLVGKPGEGGEFRLPSALGSHVLLAARTPDTLFVAWPPPAGGAEGAALVHSDITAVSNALGDAKDFFDERELLGVARDPEAGDLYSLLMLSRKGRTTLGGTRTQPWRLGVWRWKQSGDGGIMVAGRGYFFRGILPRGEAPPRTALSARMWATELTDGATVPVE